MLNVAKFLTFVGLFFIYVQGNAQVCSAIFRAQQSEVKSEVSFTHSDLRTLQDLAAAGGHEVELRNGRGIIKIGLLKRKQSQFMRFALRAVKAGYISKIDAGNIHGPKILTLLNRIRKLKTDNGAAFEIVGEMNVMTIFYLQAGQARYFEDKSLDDPNYWSKSDINDFNQALRDLKVEENCLKIFGEGIDGCGELAFRIRSEFPDKITWSAN